MTEKDYQQLSENLVQVRLDIRELMTEVRSLKDLQNEVTAHNTAITALDQSTKSAHHRLDRIDKIIFWVGTTIIGGVIIGLMALLYKS
jgi:phage shock protein A